MEISFTIRASLILLFLSPPLLAQKQQVSFIKPDSLLDNTKNSKHESVFIEHYFSEEADRHISVTQFGIESSYYLLNRISLAGNAFFILPRGERIVDLVSYQVKGIGAGVAGGPRWEIIGAQNYSFFLEFQLGISYASHEFPPLGSKFNFNQRYGAGFNVYLNPKMQLIFGYRHYHVSNAFLFGDNRNPSYNGSGLFIQIGITSRNKRNATPG